MFRPLLPCLLSIALSLFSNIGIANNIDLQVVTELSPPYQVMNGGEVSGTSTDKVRKILAKADLTASFNMYPWARAIDKATNEPNTLIYSIAKSPERLKNFHWLTPVTHFKLGLVALKNRDDLDIQFLEQLSQHIVAVQRQDVAHKWMIKQGFTQGRHFIVSADIESSWHLLLNKKVDFIFESPELMISMLNKLGLPEDITKYVLSIPELSLIGYLAANKNMDSTQLKKIKQAIADLGL